MARVTLARETFLSNAAVTRGFLFLFVFFILCVTSFFRVLLKIKKEKVKIITHTNYEHFFARTLQSSIIAREEKDAKGVKVERYRRVVSLLLHVRTTDFYRRRVCDLRRTFRVTLQQD